jgi:hypothetical protein
MKPLLFSAPTKAKAKKKFNLKSITGDSNEPISGA